tara:strand:+ start:64 stop:750 length:687 start_codon:yes stop_codon:yes gene_type:complete
MRKYLQLLLLLTLTLSSSLFALTQDEKLWLGMSRVRDLTSDGKWKYIILSESRFINESDTDVWQTIHFEGGIGNILNDTVSFWFGYRFTERDPMNGFNPEDRLFQQIVTKSELSNSNVFSYRIRLEEIKRREFGEVGLRLRHRFSLSHNEAVLFHLEPFVYDEIFTQLNRPPFTPNFFIIENRLSAGFNWKLKDKQRVQIGYINQYVMRRRNQSQNVMSHVIRVVYSL